MRVRDLINLSEAVDSKKTGRFSDGSVESWLQVMAALIIQDDQAQRNRNLKRGLYDNPKRLALTLQALQEVRADV